MLKRIFYISITLLIALWAWPAQAGCYYSCDSYYSGYYQSYPNYSSDYDPIFGGWYGVDNRNSTNNPFGDWYGVNNMDSGNPFGSWYGINNMGSSYYSSSAPTTSSNNPFGGWYGVDNRDSAYVAPRSSMTYQSQPVTYQSYASSPADYSYQGTSTYRVAPLTGVNKVAPFAFGGLLAAGLFVVRKRKWLFN